MKWRNIAKNQADAQLTSIVTQPKEKKQDYEREQEKTDVVKMQHRNLIVCSRLYYA